MRQLVIVLTTSILTAALAGCKSGPAPSTPAAPALEKGELKGVGIYCQESAKAVEDTLGKVDGVSKVSVDLKGRTVTFMAKDEAAGKAALEALNKIGLHGRGSVGKASLGMVISGGGGTDEWLIKNVHVGCPEGEKKLQEAIEVDKAVSKVTFEGEGAQKDIRIVGKNVNSGIITTINFAGFHGELTSVKKKD